MIERLREEDGMTLVELVITMMIMSIAYLAILGGMTSAIIASSLHRQQATAQTVLRSYAEAVKGLAYINCTTGTPASDPSYVHPDFDSSTDAYLRGFEPVMPASGRPNVQYWHPSTPSGDQGTFDENCTAPDTGIQKVTLAIRSADGKVNESLELVKRVKVTGDAP